MSDTKPTILITGGLGNLGSWLTDHFVNRNYNVFVLAHRKRDVNITPSYQLILADITDIDDLKYKLGDQHFDYVVHTAGAHDHFVENYSWLSLKANAWGTRNLLEIFKEKLLKQFIYFSTFQVYGKRSGTITEDTPPVPVNDYGLTHLFAEYYVRQFHQNLGIPFSILRLTNGYGAPKDVQSSKWYLILNDLARMAVAQKEIVLKSNGEASRDFVWLGTVCDIVDKLTRLESAPNDIFNISGEKTYKMIDIAWFVHQAFHEVYGEELPVKINGDDNTTYPQDLLVTNRKLKDLIDFQLTESFREEAKKVFALLDQKK